MGRSYVVTGGGRGVGRAIVERLAGDADRVVVIEIDPPLLADPRVVAVEGDAADEAVAERAADLAQAAGALAGWVNNAAVFRDASVEAPSARAIVDHIGHNLNPAVVGSVTLDAFHERGDTVGDPRGPMAVFASREAAEEFAGDDPFVVRAWHIREWREILTEP